jgi:hypothetical protein
MDCSNSGEHLGVPVNNLSYFYNPNNQPLNQWDFNNNPWSINNGLPFLDL